MNKVYLTFLHFINEMRLQRLHKVLTLTISQRGLGGRSNNDTHVSTRLAIVELKS